METAPPWCDHGHPFRHPSINFRRGAAAHHAGAPGLQRLGGQRDDGGLRAALHPAALSQVVGVAGGQHRVWRRVLFDSGGRGRHAAGAVRLYQRLLGDSGHGPDHLHGGLAHQHLCRPLRGRHGFAHPWRGVWLHRLHAHLAHLRLVHLHLFCAGGGGDGLCAGAGAGRAAQVGLFDLCAGGHSAGHARGVHHQPPAGLDAAAVAGDAGGAVCVCADARSWCFFRCVALYR